MEWKQAQVNERGLVKIPGQWVFLHYYEAFNLLFRIENALRVFVYLILKNEQGKDWESAQIIGDEGENATLELLAKKRIAQSQSFGYLGFPVTNPIVHLTSGELVRFITSDAFWPRFKKFFRGKREIMRTKLDEIGTIRNALAHFRPIRADDVDVLKQNSRHVLIGVEELLNAALTQGDTVPTNTQDDWYASLSTLGAEHCSLTLKQSIDENWICAQLNYDCPVLRHEKYGNDYFTAQVLNLQTPHAVRSLNTVRQAVTYVAESVPRPQFVKEGGIQVKKHAKFVFYKPRLAEVHTALRKEFGRMIHEIENETQLIQEDNLARGRYIRSSHVTASLTQEGESRHWSWSYSDMYAPSTHDDPPEYWGNLSFYSWQDLITGMSKYPWMAESVSRGGFLWD
jgi:hypothetical protein